MYVCKKQAKLAIGIGICLAISASAAQAQFGFVSGSDGTDGILNLAVLSAMDLDPANCPPTCDATTPCTCEIDLGAAIPGTWDATPGTGNGVYDAAQWAVVFKYTTIDIPVGVTVVFKNHPKNPPVVWLAQGDVTIDGTVNLDGKPAIANTGSEFAYAEPGPGGFAGGIRPSSLGDSSGGFGPGGGHRNGSVTGGGGGYATVGCQGGQSQGGGAAYGNEQILPLIGGSGGGGGRVVNAAEGGGAGAGAILIASSTQVFLSGLVEAGGGASQNGSPFGGAGAGGAIRLIANMMSGPGLLTATGGAAHPQNFGCGSSGRIRVEAAESILTQPGSPPFSFSNAMGPVFPPPGLAATLTIVSIDGEAVTPDPDSGIVTIETPFGNAAPVPVVIQATNVPDTTLINVILTPARGDINTAAQEAPAPITGGTATAMVIFPAGRNEIQLRANWTNP